MRSISRLHLVIALVFGAGASCASAQGVYGVKGPWIDDTSRPFELPSLAGTYTVATMAYGACQRVCSTSVRRIEELHELADRRHLSVNFVVFGLDPREDKPSDWAVFRSERHLGFRNLQFLSGTPASTRKMAEQLGLRYWRYGEHTMHDFRIVLLSPAGQVVRSIDHFDDDITLVLP